MMQIKIYNICAHGHLEASLHLEVLAAALDGAVYDPNISNALIAAAAHAGAKYKIFASGTVQVLGEPSEAAAKEDLLSIERRLRSIPGSGVSRLTPRIVIRVSISGSQSPGASAVASQPRRSC